MIELLIMWRVCNYIKLAQMSVRSRWAARGANALETSRLAQLNE